MFEIVKNNLIYAYMLFMIVSNLFGISKSDGNLSLSDERSVFDYSLNGLNSDVYIAVGCGVTSGSKPVDYDPWPERLENMLSGVSVVNLGVSHSYASDGAANINSYMKTYYPHYVLVLYGLNDSKIGIPNSTILDNLETIVRTAQYYGADVVLGTLPLVPNFTTYEAWVVQQLNDDIRDMGSQYGIEIADIEAVMGYRDSSLYIDGLHPTRTGYNMIAQEYYNHIFTTTLSGDGTMYNPYIIASIEDLNEFSNNEGLNDGYYILNTNIDLGGKTFDASVINRRFEGNFNGQGHTVSNFIIQCSNDYVGLFSVLDGGIIESLDVSFFDINGAFFVGGVCGQNDGGSIRNCNSDGNVNGTQYVGGLTGHNNYGSIKNCSSKVIITGLDYTGGFCGRNYMGDIRENKSDSIVTGGDFTGGFLGSNYKGILDENSSAGTVSGSRYVGGFLGHTGYGTVNNSYSESSVAGVDYIGGFCGRFYYGDVSYCYSSGNVSGTEYIGGFTGSEEDATFSSCYWNINLAGITNSAGGVGKTDAEMQLQTTYENWDFTTKWYMNGYSILQWQDESIKFLLTVENGSCSGSYAEGDVVAVGYISKPGYEFSSWIVEPLIYSNNLADVTLTNTTFTMPEANVTLTALRIGYSGGVGTYVEPYLISCKDDFLQIADSKDDYDKYFTMTADIDLSGETFSKAVIAPSSGIPFTGVFYGDGHKIINLIIDTNGADSDYLGLFGYINGATIQDLAVENATIVSGAGDIGVLCGYNDSGNVAQCHSTGTVNSSGRAGGLCGVNAGVISNCYSSVNVFGDTGVGGFCAQNRDGSIDNCYSAGSVNGTRNVGGFIGVNISSVNDCYSMGLVEGTINVGGFNGLNNTGGSINNCYSTGSVIGDSYVGGLCGLENGGTISDSFWDVQTSGRTGDSGGIGKTTAEMQMQATFTDSGWNFDNIWYMSDYPKLRYFGSCFDIWLSDWNVSQPNRSWDGDPAGDGIENIWKYASGLDPIIFYNVTNVFYYDLSSNSFDVIYYKSKTSDAEIVPEWKYSLSDDEWRKDFGLVNLKISETADREKWKASIPMRSNGFIRIRAVVEIGEQ